MLWPDHDNQALKPAERQLLDAVASGALDAHLVAIADAVQARRALLDTVRSANVVAELCLGDTVMFNREIRPRYLQLCPQNDHSFCAERLYRWMRSSSSNGSIFPASICTNPSRTRSSSSRNCSSWYRAITSRAARRCSRSLV
jgi:hypothetical protein